MYRRKYPSSTHEIDMQKTEEPKLRQFPAITLTVDELVDELHISRKTAYELVRAPDFPSFNIGKRILISREGLQRWVDFRSSLPLSDLSDNAA